MVSVDPVYQSILDSLRTRIREHQMEPGFMLGTEIALAAQSGISRSSMREAVSILIKEGLVERRPGKGIFVRDQAAALVIEMILPHRGESWGGGFPDGAQEAARQRHAKLQIFSADGNFEADLNAIRRLPMMKVTGAIVLSAHHIRISQQVIELHQAGFPLVMVDQRLRDVDISSVTCDDLDAGHRATTHLLSLGRRRIGFVGYQHDDGIADGRQAGYRNGLSDGGRVIDRSLEILYPYSSLVVPAERNENALAELLSKVDALILQNFELVMTCRRVIDERKLSHPPTLMTFAARREIERNSLLALEIPEYEMGLEAVRLLCERIAHPEMPAIHSVVRMKDDFLAKRSGA